MQWSVCGASCQQMPSAWSIGTPSASSTFFPVTACPTLTLLQLPMSWLLTISSNNSSTASSSSSSSH